MAADNRDLTTLANVKSYIAPGVIGNTDDATIQRLITEVSQSCSDFVAMPFFAQLYVETRNGTGMRALRMRRATRLIPITAVESVTIKTYEIQLPANPLAGGYVFDETTIYVRDGDGWFKLVAPYFTRGFQNVVVMYWGGFVTAGQVANAVTFPVGITPPAEPPNLEQVCIEATILALRRRTRIGDTGLSVQGQRTRAIRSGTSTRAPRKRCKGMST